VDTAPAPMLQVWMMQTFQEQTADARPQGVRADLFRHLEDGGFKAVVATDYEQRYERPLRFGDQIITDEVIESISDRKNTQLGPGYFITTLITFRVEGHIIGTQRWSLFKYCPKAPNDANSTGGRPEGMPKYLRPRPAINRDNEFWFEAASRRELLIQKCQNCGE